MKSRYQGLLWLLWFLLAGAIPAYANNPPQPDGILTLILIFPVAILGYRLAGAQVTQPQRKWRVLTGLLLTLCTLLTMGGTEIAMIPLLVILGYGVRRGVQAIARGTVTRRFPMSVSAGYRASSTTPCASRKRSTIRRRPEGWAS